MRDDFSLIQESKKADNWQFLLQNLNFLPRKLQPLIIVLRHIDLKNRLKLLIQLIQSIYRFLRKHFLQRIINFDSMIFHLSLHKFFIQNSLIGIHMAWKYLLRHFSQQFHEFFLAKFLLFLFKTVLIVSMFLV